MEEFSPDNLNLENLTIKNKNYYREIRIKIIKIISIIFSVLIILATGIVLYLIFERIN